jgi:hypothetical protein
MRRINTLIYTLRCQLFAHLQRLSLSFHCRAHWGELLTKITSDANALKDVFAESALMFAADLLAVVGMFTIMFALNWQLSPIVLATPPLLLYALFYLYRKIREYCLCNHMECENLSHVPVNPEPGKQR